MSGPARFLASDQLLLPIGHAPALARADFVVAPSNEAAVRLVDSWPNWRFGRVAAIVGPAACGKSHLATIFAARSGAAIAAAASLGLADEDGFGERAAVIEDIALLIDERALLHRINALAEVGASLLLTAREAPARWPFRLPDLTSRLRQIMVAEIGPPEDSLVAALLVKLFADRQIAVGPEVIAYLGSRVERSHAAICELIERLDEASLRSGRAVTLSLARAVLERQTPHINDP